MTAPAITPPKTRAHALRSPDPADFPVLTGREEEWRFTPLRRLRGLTTGTVETVAPPKHEHGELPAGVSVSMVDRADPRLGTVLTPFDRISALAGAKATGALLVSVARGATPGGAATVRLVGGGAGCSDRRSKGPDGVAFGRTFIEVGELADVTLVLEHSGSAVLADNVEVSVGNAARLTLITVADWAPDAVHAQHVKVRVGRDARVVHVQVALGGDLVRQYTSVEYADRGGECEAYGLYFATGTAGKATHGQHLEHRLLVDHAVPHCRSRVVYKTALQGDDAHTVWVGDVLIRAEATGTDTYEINRNLLLTDGARADSIPNLEIETGEVTGAGHASATGRFDDEQLFYLQSRGIPADEARRLVVRGFFADVIQRIDVPDLRERLENAIEAELERSVL